MSDNNLLILNSQIKNKVEELSNNNIVQSIDSSIYSKIIESKSSLNIKIQYKLSNINLDISSLKRIFSYNQLDYIKYLSLIQDKEELNMNIEVNSLSESLTIPVNRKTEKEINEETTEEDTTIKEDDFLNDEKNKNNVSISVKIKNDNIYDPNFPLLKNKIDNTFSNIDKVPQKYLSLIICGNKAIINLDYLKCIYPTIFCCGIFNLLYFVNIVLKIYKHMYMVFHFILCFPIALLLIITGIYGYKKVKKNIYNDEFCMILTNICSIAPIFSFALSLIYREEFENNHIITNFLINFISCFFSFSSIIILKEAERMNNSEKDILQI
jgi:hypothetical protein